MSVNCTACITQPVGEAGFVILVHVALDLTVVNVSKGGFQPGMRPKQSSIDGGFRIGYSVLNNPSGDKNGGGLPPPTLVLDYKGVVT